MSRYAKEVLLDAECSLPPTLDQVLRLARRGWPLFPAATRTKKPLICAWPDLASCDPCIIQRWLLEHPGCNWAVTTGPQSGFVLDIDGAAGRRSLAALEAKYGPLPCTRTVITGRDDGGEQRWFRYPAGRDIHNSTTKLGTGLHIRGAGGMALVPPSVHPSGRTYRWVDENFPMAEAPGWLLELLLADHGGTNDGYHQTILERSILRDGERNDGLFRYGCALRRKGADYTEILRKLLEADQRRSRPPIDDEREIRKIAKSAASYKVGGPDPLERAWNNAVGKNSISDEARFLELCRCLQKARPDQEIALPLKRIAILIGVNWGTVSRYRSDAVRRGVLRPTTPYIAGKRAGRYVFNEDHCGQERGRSALQAPLQTREMLTSGLVCTNPPSLHCPENGAASPGLRRPENGAVPSSLHSHSLHSRDDDAALGDDARIAKAHSRGESLGFAGIFLSAFTERELRLTEKWANTKTRDTRKTGDHPARDYLPWGGRFDHGGSINRKE